MAFDEGKHCRGAAGRFVAKTGGSTAADERAVMTALGVRDKAAVAASVRAFQRKHHLAVDGVVGRQTVTALLGRFGEARVALPGAMDEADAALLRQRHGKSSAVPEPKPDRRRARGRAWTVPEGVALGERRIETPEDELAEARAFREKVAAVLDAASDEPWHGTHAPVVRAMADRRVQRAEQAVSRERLRRRSPLWA